MIYIKIRWRTPCVNVVYDKYIRKFIQDANCTIVNVCNVLT